MARADAFLTPAEAARRLGVSAKALRLYERHGLLAPFRTRADWRVYGPAEMAKAAEIVALRALGLTLAQIGKALATDSLSAVLEAHQATLTERTRDMVAALARVAVWRAELNRANDDAAAGGPHLDLALDLPWPWGGERLELRGLGRIVYLTGPLGSGKTRLALRLAESIPGARFVAMDRAPWPGEIAPGVAAEAERRVAESLAALNAAGATTSPALTHLLRRLFEVDGDALVVDMVEDGLAPETQGALATYFRRHWRGGRLVLMTRSTAMLDLAALGSDESIIYCPANHSPPLQVLPVPGSPGYEAVATCLAPPEVRARTAGVVAWRPASG